MNGTETEKPLAPTDLEEKIQALVSSDRQFHEDLLTDYDRRLKVVGRYDERLADVNLDIYVRKRHEQLVAARKVTKAKKNLDSGIMLRDFYQKEQNELTVAKEKKCWERSYDEQDLVEVEDQISNNLAIANEVVKQIRKELREADDEYEQIEEKSKKARIRAVESCSGICKVLHFPKMC